MQSAEGIDDRIILSLRQYSENIFVGADAHIGPYDSENPIFYRLRQESHRSSCSPCRYRIMDCTARLRSSPAFLGTAA